MVMAAGGDLTLSWWASLILVVVVVAPAVALVAAARAKRASKRDGEPSTAWAVAALTLVRIALGALVVGALALALAGSGSTTMLGEHIELEHGWFDPDNEVDHPGQLRMTLTATEKNALTLCPSREVPADSNDRRVFGPDVTYVNRERNCWARRNMAMQYPGVEQAGWVMRARVVQPPASTVRTFYALMIANLLAVIAIGVAIERILARTARRRPFDRRNVRWLRVLAGGVAAATIVVPWLVSRFAESQFREYFGEVGRYVGQEGAPFGMTNIFLVILLLALAEVWRFGIRLQEDDEATV
jgi:hypothetical protein